jgi:hypothetical protein
MEKKANSTTSLPPFGAYVEDRKYLKNVSPKTLSWFTDVWKAFGPHLEPVLANGGRLNEGLRPTPDDTGRTMSCLRFWRRSKMTHFNNYAEQPRRNTHSFWAFPSRRGIIPDAALWDLCRYRNKSHWSANEHRLNRETVTKSRGFGAGDAHYAREELIAEIGSMMLAAETGLPHDPSQHAAYVASWLEALKKDKNEIFRAASAASKATDYVLNIDRTLETGHDIGDTHAAQITATRRTLEHAL